MTKRREFDARTKLAITKRATINGIVRCEECHCAIARWEIHHLKEDALEVDKSGKLTAEDGKLLCVPCHKEATKAFAPVIAKCRRVEAKAANIRKPSTLPVRGFVKIEREPKRLSAEKRCAGSPALMRRFGLMEDAFAVDADVPDRLRQLAEEMK